MQLNGVMLLSSILNYGRRQPGFDQEMVNYLPSYAATAAYHHRLAAQPADLHAFLSEVRDLARGPYALALAKGQDLSDAERQAIAAEAVRLHRPAGRLHPGQRPARRPGRFRKELLRDQRLTLGRYDARFTGEDFDAAGESPEYDPSDTGITGAFVAAFHDYLTRDLGYETDLDLPADLLFGRACAGTSSTRPPASAAAAATTRPTSRSTSRRPCARTRTCWSIR